MLTFPPDKPTHISPALPLRHRADDWRCELCEQAGIDPQRRAKELTDDEIARLADASSTASTWSRARCAGRDAAEHRPAARTSSATAACGTARSLPVRGQRTKTNARTRKGPRKTVAGKKGVKDK